MKGKYRHELKYNISFGEYMILRPRLKAVMKSDPKDIGEWELLGNISCT